MSRIKECFTSRFEDGVIMEADYSQLEVIVLAFLSQDYQLMKDIREGVDLHCMAAASLYNKPYDTMLSGYQAGDPDITKWRKISKVFSFQLQYGSGAKAMAEKLELPVELAKKFIKNYYARYPGVKLFQEKVASSVQASRKPSKHRTATGLPAGLGHYTSITGRRYVFQEYDSLPFMVERGKPISFSPTQMKNYPVQGFATGDIVPLMMGVLYEKLKSDPILRTKALLINTVHDSIMLDVREDVVRQAATTVKEVLEDAPTYIYKTWQIIFDLPLKVGISTGPSWAQQTEYKI